METVIQTTVLDAKALALIAGAVVALVEIIKWAGVPQRFGVLAVLACSVTGVLLWGWSYNAISRTSAFDYFAGIVVVMTSAAGVYGFVRAATPSQLTNTHRPPPAAGEE